MPRGGSRPGAGRKPNPLSKAGMKRARETVVEGTSAEVEEQARAASHHVARVQSSGGKLAKEVLSAGMNYFYGLAALYQPGSDGKSQDIKAFERYLAKASDIAGKLAPYESPRLATINVTPVPLDLSRLTNEELTQLERLHAKAAIAGGDTGGDRPTQH